MMKHKNNKFSMPIKRNVFLKGKWIYLVLIVDLIFLLLGILDYNRFDFANYVITIGFVDAAMFYFILLQNFDKANQEINRDNYIQNEV